MPLFRADYSIIGDLCFADDAAGVIRQDEEWTITLTNGPRDDQDHVAEISATVVGPAASIADVIGGHRNELAEALDMLSLATSARFRIIRDVRAVEWESGIGERELHVFLEHDPKLPPAPVLAAGFLESARAMQSNAEPWMRRAMRYYRYGLLDPESDGQFVKLWHALETIAENTKERKRIAVVCGKCKGDLYCEKCGPVTRFPMATDAIRQIIERYCGDSHVDIAARFFDARHTLMHGGNSDAVADRTGFDISQIVDELGSVVLDILYDVTGSLAQGLEFSRPSTIVNGRLFVTGKFKFHNRGPALQPEDAAIPQPAISVKHRIHTPEINN